MEEPQEEPFQPEWTDEPHIDGGVYLPLDSEKRSPHPKVVPQHLVDIAQTTYGRTNKINPPPSPPPSPLRWIPRRYGGGFRFGRSEDDEELKIQEDIEPPSLTEFQLFLKLPTELRHKVWRNALPGKAYSHINCYSLYRDRELRSRLWSRHDSSVSVLGAETAPKLQLF
jgi:hypothetical protein